MKISFDLDDTLIPSDDNCFPTERRNYLQRMLGVEKLRLYTSELFRHLQSEGHEVGVYTTSYRSRLKLWLHLFSYGITPDFIITEKENRKKLKKRQLSCSKYPPVFGIDLHVDDSLGVEREGKKYSFQTILVNKEDFDWREKIKRRVRTIKEL